MEQNHAIYRPANLGPKTQEPGCELLEMTESICCFNGSLLTCKKNQHHSSIQSRHIAYLILGITFDMPWCT